MNYKCLILAVCALSATSTITPSSSLSLSSGIQAGAGAAVGLCAGAFTGGQMSRALGLSPASYKAVGLTAACGALASYAGWKFLFRYTPEGRVARARHELENLPSYQLSILQRFEYDEDMLRKTLQQDYIAYPFPLVTAFHVIQNMRNTVINAQDLLYAARNGQDPRSVVAQECNELLDESADILQTMQRTITILTSTSDWASMVTAYNAARALEVQQAMLLQMQLNAIQPHCYVHYY